VPYKVALNSPHWKHAVCIPVMYRIATGFKKKTKKSDKIWLYWGVWLHLK